VVWDLSQAFRELTPTRERICINGLWRWQPAQGNSDRIPQDAWGFFKVPGAWPGIEDYMQKDCQVVHAHPRWKEDVRLRDVRSAWYQREMTVPEDWAGRRIFLHADYVNSYAAVYLDGKPAGPLHFPGGAAELTQLCRPGEKHVLSLRVVAMPLRGVIRSYSDPSAAREVKGTVNRRGLCGDIFLEGLPPGPTIADVKVDASVRRWELTIDVALRDLAPGQTFGCHARVLDGDREVRHFRGPAFSADDLRPESYAGGKVAPHAVLVVAPGGGDVLSDHKADVREFLASGGLMLAVGLTGAEASSILPFPVTTHRAEHIDAYFEPSPASSPLVGVGPSDVHNRAAAEIRLIATGGDLVGNGVLATAAGGSVVFCQLVPWQFDDPRNYGVKATFRRTSCLVTRLLANLGAGVASPLLVRFSDPVAPGENESRWFGGYYLEVPESWDDPYRFFRW
jgi:hypothetical protein